MSDMTNAAAIDLLDNLILMMFEDDYESDYDTALRMAIDALKTQAERTEERTKTHTCDYINRKDAIDAVETIGFDFSDSDLSAVELEEVCEAIGEVRQEWLQRIKRLPSAQPTLYGYNIEHLELITRVLQKEDLPPERVVEVLADVGKIVAIVKDEFEEALRKAVEQCMT